MPLVPSVIIAGMTAAWEAADAAAVAAGAPNVSHVAAGGSTSSMPVSAAAIDSAAAAAFGSVAGAAIDAYIRSGIVSPGIPVTTAGSALAQVGATTGPGVIV